MSTPGKAGSKLAALRAHHVTTFEEQEAALGLNLSSEQRLIPDDVSFRAWCESLDGLKVDGQPFDLSDRPAMAWVYDQVPSTREEAFRKTLTIMKCAQVGFTTMEMLIALYFALKFDGFKIGMFLPDMNLARGISTYRFLPVLRSVPAAHALLAQQPGRPFGEGNVMTRTLGASFLHFLWTSGKAATESYPMDLVAFDEVQEMLIGDIEKVQERLSASKFKFTLMGSTANWPDADIHYFYQKGTCHRFHTLCPTCGVQEPLDAYFPDCIHYDDTCPDRVTREPGDWRYVCREGHWIDNPQVGEWIADNPEAAKHKAISIHFHQMLSPTISPREMMEAFQGADDIKNFYNRKLGKPYQDPSLVPVTLAHLLACAEAGMAAGVVWKTRARNTCMGIDQMGAFNVVIIKERLADGRQSVIHVEEIYSDDPFGRCDELMDAYGVQVCAVETLPNYNDAHRFAARHLGKVFLASYGDLKDDAMRWGDAPALDVSDRRTAEPERTRYTVTLDQYKCMSLSLARLVHTACLFPDPAGLVQEIREKGHLQRLPILKDRVFVHFQKTGLVTERVNERERKLRRKVVKIGIDPHFAFANMLCDVAYSRAHGTATIFLPGAETASEDRQGVAARMNLQGAPAKVLAALEPFPPGEICGNCTACPMGPDGTPAKFFCKPRNFDVQARDPGCEHFVGADRS